MLVGLSLLLLFVNTIGVCFGLREYYHDGTSMDGTDYSIPDYNTYNSTLPSVDIQSVFTDLFEVLLTSDSCWAADSFNGEESYGGLLLRLAWHTAGVIDNTNWSYVLNDNSSCNQRNCTPPLGSAQKYLQEYTWV